MLHNNWGFTGVMLRDSLKVCSGSGKSCGCEETCVLLEYHDQREAPNKRHGWDKIFQH
jgi:hypothetical protein